jgi:hypothetical protein
MHLDSVRADQADRVASLDREQVSTIYEVLEAIVNQGVEGFGPLCSAKDLGAKYEAKTSLSPGARVQKVVRNEARKTFGVGFVTGLGGFITLPVTMPVGIAGASAFQSRMIGTIAELSGFDSDDPRVRTLTTLCLYGDAAGDLLKAAGIFTARDAIERLSRRALERMLLDMIQRGAVRTSTRLGSAALARGLPAVGGLLGGTVDYGITKGIGRHAARTFVQSS